MKYLFFILSIATTSMWSCNKFLDSKPDQRLAVPHSLQDYQALMDNVSKLSGEPKAGEMSSDDFYLTFDDWASLASEEDKRTYIWEEDHLFDPSGLNDWRVFSEAVYYCNTVIEGLENAKYSTEKQHESGYRNTLGQAHYFRGKRLLQASFIWCNAYDSRTAQDDLGLPLRLSTDFNKPSVRANLKETFELILTDMKVAAANLPVTSINVARPSKPAAFGVLARTYLYMGDYEKALLYADSCLQLRSGILNFNDLNPDDMLPIPAANIEIISENGIPTGQILNMTRARVDSVLYDQYEENDLRKHIYFTENADEGYNFRGRMNQAGISLFSGISTTEMYFIRMECLVRQGNAAAALNDLNRILQNRYIINTYSDIDIEGFQNPLQRVLDEKRKELIFRGIRWPDIKRLNREGAEIKIIRVLGENTYELEPNDLRYALPIPEDVINISGMEQNAR